MRHPFLPIRQAIQKRPAHPYAFRTCTQGFHYICSPSNAAVEVDFTLVEYLRSMFAQFKQGI